MNSYNELLHTHRYHIGLQKYKVEKMNDVFIKKQCQEKTFIDL